MSLPTSLSVHPSASDPAPPPNNNNNDDLPKVKLYIQRNIQHALQDPETQRSPSGSMLLVLKQLNLDVHEIRVPNSATSLRPR
eukprot:4175-Rhodomonas_salina.1